MIICRSRQFNYFHIHKAGGSSIEIALEPHLKWNDYILGSTPFGEACSRHYGKRFGIDKHSSYLDVEKECGAWILDSSFNFSTVRHPAERICSLYNFVGTIVSSIIKSSNSEMPELRENYDKFSAKHWELTWPASRAFVFADSFAEFLVYPDLVWDSAFHSQASRLKNGRGEVSVQWYRLEDQQEQLISELKSRFGIELKIPHENKSARKFIASKNLTRAELDVIKDRFREDFEAFGYAPL